MAQKLDQAARQGMAARLPGWQLVDGRDAIQKTFKFKDFSEASALWPGRAGGREDGPPPGVERMCGTGWR